MASRRNLAVAIADRLLNKPHVADIKARIEKLRDDAFERKDRAAYDEYKPLADDLARHEKSLVDAPKTQPTPAQAKTK